MYYVPLQNIYLHAMKFKKLVTVILILILVLQVLPIRQAVRYFLIDNQTTEEVVHLENGATKKFKLLEEDHKYLQELAFHSQHFIFVNNIPALHYAETLPLFHYAAIHTPPPNCI